MDAMAQKAQALRDEISSLRRSRHKRNALLKNVSKTNDLKPLRQKPEVQRLLKGHFGKIYAMRWDRSSKYVEERPPPAEGEEPGPATGISTLDSCRLISASQDGKLILWNGYKTNKENAVPLADSWVMSCDISNNCDTYNGKIHLASCGMDTNLTIFTLDEGGHTKYEMKDHSSFVSSCRFSVNGKEITTSSADKSCILWDVPTKKVSRSPIIRVI